MDEKDIVLPNDSVSKEPIQDTTTLALEITAPIVIPTSIEITTVGVNFDNVFYCSTCRLRLSDSQLMKTPIDYEINKDGSSSTVPERYSLFCGTCQKFLGIHDPKAQKELNDMTSQRMEAENARKPK